MKYTDVEREVFFSKMPYIPVVWFCNPGTIEK